MSAARWPLTALAVAALASLAAGEETARPGRFRLGPLYFSPRLELRTIGVDTNVYNDESDAIRDSSGRLTPSFKVLWPAGRTQLSGDVSIDAFYFGTEASERSLDRRFIERLAVVRGRLRPYFEAGQGRYKQRFSIEIDDRLKRTEDWLGAGLEWELIRRLELRADLRESRYRFGESAGTVQRALDRDLRSLHLELRREVTARTRLVGGADILEDTFQAGGKARSYRYLLGLEFTRKAALSGRLLGGYRRFPGGEAAPAFSGFALDVGVAARIGSLGRLELGGTRDVLYSAALSGPEALRNSFVSELFTARLTSELPFALIVRPSWGRERASFLLPYDTPAGPVDRVDHGRVVGLDLLRAFGRQLRVGFGVTWNHRDSPLPTARYSGAQYGLQAEWTP